MIATAVILGLNACASLRETAAIKGVEKFFTQRHKGAPEDRRSAYAMVRRGSQFSSLRPLSEVFTPAGKGAKGEG